MSDRPVVSRTDDVEVEIRAATPADAPALSELARQLGYNATPDQVSERLASLPPDDELIVAEAGGEVVAWIHLTLHRSIIEETTAFIFGFVVEEHWRSRGIGQRMLDAADDYAVRHGARRLTLRSNVIRERAHEFYRRMGFTVVKQQLAFSRPLPNDES